MMGIQKLPEIEMYWAAHSMWNSSLITSTMSRNKFEAIGTYLSIGDPRSDKKLARTERLSEIINEKCRTFYSPRAKLSIDESMIAYKRRHGLRQYISMKPTQWGFKAFLLCEGKAGYCIRHIFYDGPKKEEFKPKNIVLKLCESFENQQKFIYADNYYSSFALSKELLFRGINFTGTVRTSSKNLSKKMNSA